MTTFPPREHVLRACRDLVRGLRAHDAFQAAAAIAFWFFLSLVPLLILIGYVVAQVARSQGVDALLSPLLDVVPPTAEELVHKELERLAKGSTSSLAPLGIVGYLWTASSGLHSLMDVFETTARVEARAWWKKRAMALGWVALGLAAACLMAWLLMQVDAAFQVQTRLPSTAGRLHVALKGRIHRPLQTPTEQVIAALLLLVVGMALLAGFYRFAVEHPARVRRRVWPGTVTAVACWFFVSWAFGAYVVSIADYAIYYGSLAAVAVLLVWLYLTSLTLLVGAEVNAQLEGVHASPSALRAAKAGNRRASQARST